MSVNPQTTGNLNWHIADTGNGKGVRLCCFCEVAWVENPSVMLLSHCGEYMANGLTNAVRHEFVMIANDRQTFVSVRKHSRSFLWCFECYAGLTSGECMENGLTNAIRHQFAIIAK